MDTEDKELYTVLGCKNVYINIELYFIKLFLEKIIYLDIARLNEYIFL